MNIINSVLKTCPCCMEEHEVMTVKCCEETTYKDTAISFDATYYYCDKANEYFEDEEQLQSNDLKIKDAYKRKEGLLTSSEIKGIRTKYGISQTDFSILLGWGGKTITRYESHQVQDKAHDSILKKIDNDPEWFIYLLEACKSSLSQDAYIKYYSFASSLYRNEHDTYLCKAIQAEYALYTDPLVRGNSSLCLDKVVDLIRYFAASPDVTNLYKVKLMKLMWYTDALSFKTRGKTITGLVYKALPMGAVPVGCNSIIELSSVPCEEIDTGDSTAYHFVLRGKQSFPSLVASERAIIDEVIIKLGKMSKTEIVDFMHSEMAYKETKPREIISFKYAECLQI